MTYLLLFLEFFKTGLLAVGGGLATLPFLLMCLQSTVFYAANLILTKRLVGKKRDEE